MGFYTEASCCTFKLTHAISASQAWKYYFAIPASCLWTIIQKLNTRLRSSRVLKNSVVSSEASINFLCAGFFFFIWWYFSCAVILLHILWQGSTCYAGKCGTDALITYLNTSDSFIINTIYNGDLKELNYFNNNYDKGTSWWANIFVSFVSK